MKRVLMLLIVMLISSQGVKPQEKADYQYTGVAVSPSSIRLSIRPGESATREITITNDTKKKYTFQILLQEFDLSEKGNVQKTDEKKFSLVKHVTVVPNYFEIAPGAQQKLKVIINIPDEEESYFAKWCIIAIDEVVPRPALDIPASPTTLAFGVTQSLGFGVFVYQNPPNVKVNKLEILDASFEENQAGKFLNMNLKNVGDGISYCVSYIELTNLNTGEQKRIANTKFTVLPQRIRKFSNKIPEDLEKGLYSAMWVIDYGNSDEMVAAEIEFEIK